MAPPEHSVVSTSQDRLAHGAVTPCLGPGLPPPGIPSAPGGPPPGARRAASESSSCPFNTVRDHHRVRFNTVRDHPRVRFSAAREDPRALSPPLGMALASDPSPNGAPRPPGRQRFPSNLRGDPLWSPAAALRDPPAVTHVTVHRSPTPPGAGATSTPPRPAGVHRVLPYVSRQQEGGALLFNHRPPPSTGNSHLCVPANLSP